MLEKGCRELLCSTEWQGVAGFIGTAGWRKYDECNGKMFPRQKCCTCIGICVVGSEKSSILVGSRQVGNCDQERFSKSSPSRSDALSTKRCGKTAIWKLLAKSFAPNLNPALTRGNQGLIRGSFTIHHCHIVSPDWALISHGDWSAMTRVFNKFLSGVDGTFPGRCLKNVGPELKRDRGIASCSTITTAHEREHDVITKACFCIVASLLRCCFFSMFFASRRGACALFLNYFFLIQPLRVRRQKAPPF